MDCSGNSSRGRRGCNWDSCATRPTGPGRGDAFAFVHSSTTFWGLVIELSRDGSRLTFIAEENGTTKVFLRELDQLHTKPIEGTEGGYRWPFFSQTASGSGSLARTTSSRRCRSPVITLCDAPDLRGATWGPDDRIYFRSRAAGPGVTWIAAVGGTPQIVTEPEESTQHHPLQMLPDRETLLLAVPGPSGWDDIARSSIQAFSLVTGEYRTLIEGALVGRYIETSHLVFARAGSLLAVPFDLARLEVTGPEVPVIEGILDYGDGRFSISDNGTLAYVPGSYSSESTLVWVDRAGEAEPVSEKRGYYSSPRISPDGRRIAITIEQVENVDIWLYDIGRGTLTRLTLSDAQDWSPVWSPDGTRLVFESDRDGPVLEICGRERYCRATHRGRRNAFPSLLVPRRPHTSLPANSGEVQQRPLAAANGWCTRTKALSRDTLC